MPREFPQRAEGTALVGLFVTRRRSLRRIEPIKIRALATRHGLAESPEGQGHAEDSADWDDDGRERERDQHDDSADTLDGIDRQELSDGHHREATKRGDDRDSRKLQQPKVGPFSAARYGFLSPPHCLERKPRERDLPPARQRERRRP